MNTTVPIYTLRSERSADFICSTTKCGNPIQAAEILQAYLWEKECEHLQVMMVDGHHTFLGMSTVATGGISGMRAGVRDVFKLAIVHRASAIILGHNHPSGDVSPSEEDIEFTRRVVDAGRIIDCRVVDHIIVSSGLQKGYYSFALHSDRHTFMK